MQKQEFEERIERTVTDERYKVIEEVYMWHPSIRNTSGKRICEAYCQELLQIAPKVTQKALEEHLKMQKRQQKRDRERLEEARRPFEELNEQYVGFSETTGGIELMIGGKKQEKAAKVITIPTDRTYQQGFRAEKREEPEADSEYMSRQAENALKKLRAIGG